MKKDNKIKPIADSRLKSGGEQSLSKPKEALFRIVMVLLPFTILLFAEIGLRIFEYGGNLDLFVLKKTGDVTEFVLNKDFTKRYFFQKGINPPVPLSQTFSAIKDNNTYRIFCVGESTVQGFPYPPNAAFPALLKNILSTLHPDKNIEVINCGITAITSITVMDMTEEILEKYRPDLLVVYSGHNEFYGVFGQASRLFLFEDRTMLQLFLKLQHSKLFLLMRDIINSVFGKDISNDPTLHRGTFMANVAKNAGIKLSDKIIKITEDFYRENIEEIIEKAKEQNTNILICNEVVNLKDFYPFASMHSEDFAQKDSALWNRLITEAEEEQTRNNFEAAIDLYLQALKIDASFAETHYQLGRCYYNIKDYKAAKEHFELASDLDVIRFRAPGSFNVTLKKVCDKNDIPLVDVNKDFSEISVGGIIGLELLTEHVHPNQMGYLQIAKSISKVMSENGFIRDNWDWTKNLSDSAYLSMSSTTILDEEIANYTLFYLTSYWPFNNYHKKDSYTRIGNERTEQLAKSFIESNKGSSVEFHLKYGLELENSKKFNEALAEYKAALAIEPISETYNRIGRLYLTNTEIAYKDLKDYNSAQQYYKRSQYYFAEGLKRWPNDLEMNFNLGLLYLMRNDKLSESETLFVKVLDLDPKHKNALQQLSELYILLNQSKKAKALLEKAIEFYPGHARFYTNLGVVLMNENQLEEAKSYLQKAIAIDNDQKAKYFIKKLNTM
jgi:tetratricopeptide (TPR) repeat protein